MENLDIALSGLTPGYRDRLLSKENTGFHTHAFPLFDKSNNLLAGKDCDSHEAFRQIEEAGGQPFRFYHDTQHFLDVANLTGIKDWRDAVRFRAAMNHDVVYHHVDRKAASRQGFTPAIEGILSRYIEQKNGLIEIRQDGSLDEDRFFQAALVLFGYDNAQRKNMPIRLNPYAGQNEFLSALYAAHQGQELGIQNKYILSEMAHIQGTIPFAAPDSFNALRKRLDAASMLFPDGQRLTAKEKDQTIRGAVDMANQDVVNFREGFAEAFLPNALLLYIESAFETPNNLDKPAHHMQAMMGQAAFLEGVIKDPENKSVFRSFHGVPDDDQLNEWQEVAARNVNALGQYFRANAAATSLVTAINISAKRKPPVPDAVNLKELLLKKRELRVKAHGELDECGQLALKETKKDCLLTDRVAGYLLETLGSKGIIELGDLAQNTGINPQNEDPVRHQMAKPGIATQQTANEFLKNAARLCRKHNVDFEVIRNDLEALMRTRKQSSRGVNEVCFPSASGTEKASHASKTLGPALPIALANLPETMTSRGVLEGNLGTGVKPAGIITRPG